MGYEGIHRQGRAAGTRAQQAAQQAGRDTSPAAAAREVGKAVGRHAGKTARSRTPEGAAPATDDRNTEPEDTD